MVDKVDWIWMDGEFVRWEDANVHILTHTLHYGVGAFEGIRAYRRADGQSIVFRLREHIDRLYGSCHLVRMEIPFPKEQVLEASLRTLARNGLEEGYLRPLAYIGTGRMGLYATDNPIHLALVAWRWGAYLGEEGLRRGIRARVSSFTRHAATSTMSKGKIVGHYVNSILAKREAMLDGYDEAILLDRDGFVSEASGENIFIVKDGVVKTPPFGTSILGGITRDTVITLLHDAGVPVVEARFARDEVYLADEVFFTGTAAEVTPVREVDNRRIGAGEPGPIAKDVQARFFDVVRGSGTAYARWLTPYEPAAPTAG
jgi:branched-chain amino acid aminotransferase